MREILFRGKTIVGEAWVQGFLVEKSDPVYENIKYYFILRQERNQPGNMLSSFATWHEVEPSTVGQYTGLTDKNGKRIFEGDILNTKLESGNFAGFEWPYMKVGFIDGAFCLIDKIGRVFAVMGAFAPNISFEVIGNIHDNPELLEV